MRNKKNIFKIYIILLCIFAFTLGTSSTVFAADDPLSVINKLSDLIYGMLRAVGIIVLGYSIFQIGTSLKSQDPAQRAVGIMTFAGGVIMTFAKEIVQFLIN